MEGDLLIADGQRSLALAGIMGGANSMVQDDTASIVLEAAFLPPNASVVRALRLGAGTDSSAALKRPWHPMVPWWPSTAPFNCSKNSSAERRGAGPLSRWPTQHPAPHPQTGSATRAPPRWSCNRAGTAAGIAGPIGHYQQMMAARAYNVPWWRHKDLEISEDLVEEVLRQHGYEHLIDRIAAHASGGAIGAGERAAGAIIRKRLSAHGRDEVQTYVFTDPAWTERLGWAENEVVTLVNAPAADQGIMRRKPNI